MCRLSAFLKVFLLYISLYEITDPMTEDPNTEGPVTEAPMTSPTSITTTSPTVTPKNMETESDSESSSESSEENSDENDSKMKNDLYYHLCQRYGKHQAIIFYRQYFGNYRIKGSGRQKLNNGRYKIKIGKGHFKSRYWRNLHWWNITNGMYSNNEI